MPEFELIEELVARIRDHGSAGPPCNVDIGDDAAVLDIPAGHQLVVTTDTLNSGVHFFSDMPAHAIGHKALAVNLSDLAAMGADPCWFFLALSLPAPDELWLADFSTGMGALAARSDVRLAGGDTTRGPLSITITALGVVPSGASLTRSGARDGDLVVVSGTPGLARRALEDLGKGRNPSAGEMRPLYYPEPRLGLAHLLRGKASACIDLSDGLAADLGHVLAASGVAAVLDAEKLPGRDTLPLAYQLAGGDDYELCFCLSQRDSRDLPAWREALGVPLTVIGRIHRGQGLTVVDGQGRRLEVDLEGFDHFAAEEAIDEPS